MNYLKKAVVPFLITLCAANVMAGAAAMNPSLAAGAIRVEAMQFEYNASPKFGSDDSEYGRDSSTCYVMVMGPLLQSASKLLPEIGEFTTVIYHFHEDQCLAQFQFFQEIAKAHAVLNFVATKRESQNNMYDVTVGSK